MAAFKTFFTATLLLASAFSASALSSPIKSARDATAPPSSSSYPTNSFRLTAHTISSIDLDPSVDGREVGFTVRNGTEGTLVLVPQPGLTGAVFQRGTLDASTVSAAAFPCAPSSSRRDAAGVVVRPGGSFTIPAAWPVDLRCGNATRGVAIRPDRRPGSNESLQFQEGEWMACRGSVLGLTDGVVALGYRTPTQRTLLGCADVKLVPTYV